MVHLGALLLQLFFGVAVIFCLNAIYLLRSLMAEGMLTSGIERRMLMKMTTSNSRLVSGELFYILHNKLPYLLI